MGLLRNLACNSEADIAMTIQGIGETKLFTLVEEKMWSSREEIVLQVRRILRVMICTTLI